MPDYLQYPSLCKLMLMKAASCIFDHECMYVQMSLMVMCSTCVHTVCDVVSTLSLALQAVWVLCRNTCRGCHSGQTRDG